MADSKSIDAHGGENDVWKQAFTEEQQQFLLDDDSRAWRNITVILLTIIVFGVMLGGTGVSIITFMS